MAMVELRPHDSVESALRRLKRILDKEGVPKECRERQHFQKHSEKRKLEKARARKRWLKKLEKEKPVPIRESDAY